MSRSGEKMAWSRLQELPPGDVCRRAGVDYDKQSAVYRLTVLNADIFVSPGEQKLYSLTETGTFILQKLSYFSILSVLLYLLEAQDIPLSGELVRPASIKGGEIFIKGTHVLPVGQIAAGYGDSVESFVRRCRDLGGEPLTYADASFRLYPFPRTAVAVLLWGGDDEFPARADILLDAAVERHLPPDMIWSMMMMTVSMINAH